MANDSSIEWTDATWNPIAGCTPVSPGCLNCYAAQMAARLAAMGQQKYVGLTVKRDGRQVYNGTINFDEDGLTAPLRWKRPRMVFVNSMSDLFHEDVPFEFVDQVFAVMALCPQHTFQVLTKRPERMAEYMASRGADGAWAAIPRQMQAIGGDEHDGWRGGMSWPLPNVWLGTSVEDQKRADERIAHLRMCPAAVRFLSVEPLLGPVDLHDAMFQLTRDHTDEYQSIPLGAAGVHWVIVGGESGSNARPMHPDWARSIRDQCQDAGVPFFFKQWGAWLPGEQDAQPPFWNFQDGSTMDGHWFPDITASDVPGWAYDIEHAPVVWRRVGKKAAGRLLDGRTWDQMPAAVRERSDRAMFGPMHAGKYLRLRAAAKSAKRRTVTRQEFIRLMVDGGRTAEEAEFQADISIGTGSAVLIGNELLSIGSPAPKGTGATE